MRLGAKSSESGSIGFGDNNPLIFEIESMPVEVSDLEKLTNALDTAF